MKLFATTTTAALLLIAGACGERARFQPTEDGSAVSPSGQPAASYELRADQSSPPKITVDVWSEGAFRRDSRTFVDLSVQVRNTGDEEIALDADALALEAFNLQGTPLPVARLAAVAAAKRTYTVGPRGASMMKLRFELPVALAPSEVGALRFRWGVIRADGERYVQFTEFRRQLAQVAAAHVHYDPIFGFYDPYFYGAPYGYRLNYYVPVRRVIVQQRAPRRR